MAPRTAKAKKAVDVKVADSEAPKKGRGKAKVIEDPEPEVLDSEVSEEVAAATDKKSKRGKKVANGQDNDKSEDSAPPAKKGRKKVAEETNDDKPNDDNSADEESTPSEQNLENGDSSEANGDAMEVQNGNAKGRKKPAKKESAADVKPKQTGRGRKNAKPAETEADQEVVDEKPKSAGKGRGRKAPAKSEPESQEKSEDNEEEPKPEPAPAKGRKKAQPKAVKEKTPESEKEEVEAENMEVEDEQPEEPKKKESKGRKNQGKKAQAKEESVEKDEDKEEPPAKKRKGAKKDEKAKGDVKEEEATDDVEEKPAKGKRGQKKVAEPSAEADEEPQDTGEQPTKRRRKQAEEKAPAADKKKAPLKNKAATDYEELDFSNSSQNTQGKEWNFKISSWNVDGIRAWMNKGGLDYIKYEKPDILCLQEVKCAQDKLPEEIASVPGYHAYWLCSDKDGYAGVGIYTAKLAMNVQYGLQNEELDSEGRIITAEYEHFYLITTYVPNAGRKLVTLPKRLQWNEEFRKYVKELDKKKPVIICGDMNVAHNEIDLANPKTNRKNAGFTDEERSGMSELLGDGFVDTYRHLNPDKTGAYTFWTYMMNSRSKNVGWRLDYFIVSERLLPSLCDSVIRDGVYGSDHCPISLFLHLSSADKPK